MPIERTIETLIAVLGEIANGDFESKEDVCVCGHKRHEHEYVRAFHMTLCTVKGCSYGCAEWRCGKRYIDELLAKAVS